MGKEGDCVYVCVCGGGGGGGGSNSGEDQGMGQVGDWERLVMRREKRKERER